MVDDFIKRYICLEKPVIDILDKLLEANWDTGIVSFTFVLNQALEISNLNTGEDIPNLQTFYLINNMETSIRKIFKDRGFCVEFYGPNDKAAQPKEDWVKHCPHKLTIRVYIK